MKQPKAIIFDLDGVIVDTAKFHYEAWKKIANDLGLDFTKAQNEHLKGVSRVESLNKILKWSGVTLNQEEKDVLLEAKNKHYLSLISHMDETELLEGIPVLLGKLVEAKVPFALGSASKNARLILDILHLSNLFSAIVDGTDVTKAKPDPEVFLIAAERLGYKPEDCIVVEDSKAGIQAARTAGMVSVGIGAEDVLGEADVILDDTSQLTYDLLSGL